MSAGNGGSSQRHSLSVSKVENRIFIKKEVIQYELGFRILKVPEYYRQPPTEYTPIAWRFGLHNRGDFDITGSEDVKLSVVAGYPFTDNVDGIRSFCEAVVPNPTSMLICYGLHDIGSKLDEDEIKEVLAFDALFLATKIDMLLSDRRLLTIGNAQFANKEFLQLFRMWISLVHMDLCKIENQVPFDLIKRAIKYINMLTNPAYEDEGDLVNDVSRQHKNDKQVHVTQLAMPKEGFGNKAMKCIMECFNHKQEDMFLLPSDDSIANMEQWMKKAVEHGVYHFMIISEDFYSSTNANLRLSQSYHILDAAHKAICGENGRNLTSAPFKKVTISMSYLQRS